MRVVCPELVCLLRARPQRYNRDAEELAGLHSRTPVTQVTVPAGCRLVDHVDTDLPQIRACIRLGVAAVASLVLETGAEREAAA